MTTSKKFHGAFALYLDLLLAGKRALGLKYFEEERLMHVFDDLSLNYDCSKGLTKELVLAYVENQPHWSRRTQQCRAYIARKIAIFLNQHDIPAYIYDCISITKKAKSTFKPYIFSHKQISNIFNYVDNNLRSKKK